MFVHYMKIVCLVSLKEKTCPLLQKVARDTILAEFGVGDSQVLGWIFHQETEASFYITYGEFLLKIMNPSVPFNDYI